MPNYVAFLRAINVGGHTVKMDHLRSVFESLGFARVETFIASGNVLFQSPSADTPALEARVESGLRAALGYEVATFIRTPSELAAVAAYQPIAPTLNIAFLKEPPDPASVARLIALRTDIDDFQVRGREVFWLCRVKQSESTFSNAALEKAIRRPATLRGAATVRKLADKCSRSALDE